MRKAKTEATTEAVTEAATVATTEAATPVAASTQLTAGLSLAEANGDAIPSEVAQEIRETSEGGNTQVVGSGKMKVLPYQVTDSKTGELKFNEDGSPLMSSWLDGFALKVVTSTKHGAPEHYLKLFGRVADFVTMLATAKAADSELKGVIGSIFLSEGITLEDIKTITGNGCPIYMDVPKPGLNKVMVRGTDGVERPATELVPVFWLKVTRKGTIVFSLYGSYVQDRNAMTTAWNGAKNAAIYGEQFGNGYVSGLVLNYIKQGEVKAARTGGTAAAVVTAAGPAIATDSDLGSLTFADSGNRQNRSGGYGDGGYRNRGSNRGNGGYRGRSNGSYGRSDNYGRGDNRSSGRSRW